MLLRTHLVIITKAPLIKQYEWFSIASNVGVIVVMNMNRSIIIKLCFGFGSSVTSAPMWRSALTLHLFVAERYNKVITGSGTATLARNRMTVIWHGTNRKLCRCHLVRVDHGRWRGNQTISPSMQLLCQPDLIKPHKRTNHNAQTVQVALNKLAIQRFISKLRVNADSIKEKNNDFDF